MRKVKGFSQVINAIGEIEKETEKVMDDFQTILKRVTNPGMPAERIIQELLGVRDRASSAIRSLNRIREIAIEERIEVEEKSPQSK